MRWSGNDGCREFMVSRFLILKCKTFLVQIEGELVDCTYVLLSTRKQEIPKLDFIHLEENDFQIKDLQFYAEILKVL